MLLAPKHIAHVNLFRRGTRAGHALHAPFFGSDYLRIFVLSRWQRPTWILGLHSNYPTFAAPGAKCAGVAGTEHLHLPPIIHVRGQRLDECTIEIGAWR